MNSVAIGRFVLIVPLLLATCPIAGAQALAEIARKEEERRKTITTPSKVYSNETLSETPLVSIVGASPDAGSEASPSEGATDRPKTSPEGQGAHRSAPVDNRRDEKHWRGRITEARAELSRQEVFLQALQTRVNSLTSDFVARDDPAQRGVLASDRQKALAEMERVRADIQQLTTTIREIEEEARRAGVPPGWLR